MVVIFQLIISAVLGLIAYGLCMAFGVSDPWPQVIGIAVFCICMGVCVVVVDADGDIW